MQLKQVRKITAASL